MLNQRDIAPHIMSTIEPIIIKKYANRRLYNTDTSAYVTLENLADMVRECRDFEVVDAKTGTDITHQILTQIIFESENKASGAALMPVSFMRNLIRLYDHSLHTMVPPYLEMMMEMFVQNKDKLKESSKDVLGNFNGLEAFNPMNWPEIQRKNMEIFQKSFGAFNPFLTPSKDTPSSDSDEPDKDAHIVALNKKIAEMERKMAQNKAKK